VAWNQAQDEIIDLAKYEELYAQDVVEEEVDLELEGNSWPFDNDEDCI
jgi:hypothetical protein